MIHSGHKGTSKSKKISKSEKRVLNKLKMPLKNVFPMETIVLHFIVNYC